MAGEHRTPSEPTYPSLAWRETGPKPNDLVSAPHNGFRFEWVTLADSLGAVDYEGTDGGIQRFGDIPAERIAAAVRHAEMCKAIAGPEGVVFSVLKLAQRPDTVILGLHEGHDRATSKLQQREEAGLGARRQVTTWEIEPHELSDPQDPTFGGLCLTLEDVCDRLNGLLGPLQALLDGETDAARAGSGAAHRSRLQPPLASLQLPAERAGGVPRRPGAGQGDVAAVNRGSRTWRGRRGLGRRPAARVPTREGLRGASRQATRGVAHDARGRRQDPARGAARPIWRLRQLPRLTVHGRAGCPRFLGGAGARHDRQEP